MTQDYLHPILPYEKINVDHNFYLVEGKENRRKRKLCDKAFDGFKKLRGAILSNAVAVEKELDRVISYYFVRATDEHDPESEEIVIRRDRFVDLVLGSGLMTFDSKAEIVEGIVGKTGSAEIPGISKQSVKNKLKSVSEIRNRFAHRKVGVDWENQGIHLWNAKKHKWEAIAPNQEKLYEEACRKAVTLLSKVWKEVLRLSEVH